MKKLSRYIVIEKSYCSGGLFIHGSGKYPRLFTRQELQRELKNNKDIFTTLPVQVSRSEVDLQQYKQVGV